MKFITKYLSGYYLIILDGEVQSQAYKNICMVWNQQPSDII